MKSVAVDIEFRQTIEIPAAAAMLFADFRHSADAGKLIFEFYFVKYHCH